MSPMASLENPNPRLAGPAMGLGKPGSVGKASTSAAPRRRGRAAITSRARTLRTPSMLAGGCGGTLEATTPLPSHLIHLRKTTTALICLLCVSRATAETREPRGVTWTVEWANDAVFHSDNQFSNGFFVHMSGPAVQDWAQARGTPAFGKRMAAWFLPQDRDGMWLREAWSVGQIIQTPNDLSRSDPIPDDVPYGAILAIQNAWMAYDDRNLHAFGWLYGVVGPAAQGEPVQKGFHRII